MRVRAPPEIVRRQRQHADHAADPVVHQPMAEERAVAAIVLDHEQADQKAAGGNGQQQIKPVADMERTHINDQSRTNGTTVIRISTMLRPWFGSRYRARLRVKARKSTAAASASVIARSFNTCVFKAWSFNAWSFNAWSFNAWASVTGHQRLLSRAAEPRRALQACPPRRVYPTGRRLFCAESRRATGGSARCSVGLHNQIAALANGR